MRRGSGRASSASTSRSGVVTGIPMEFQFGTNWAGFSKYAGGVVGQTLAMEGMFAFFLESAFIGALVWGEKRLGPKSHFLAALAVAVGSWTSGYFILVTNAFMQYPTGYSFAADGSLRIQSLSRYLLSPWALIQFCHNQAAALVTGSFVIAAVGAFYVLRGAIRAGSALAEMGHGRRPVCIPAGGLSDGRCASENGGAPPATRRWPPWRGALKAVRWRTSR